MRVLKHLLTVVACVGVIHMGTAAAADAPKEAPKKGTSAAATESKEAPKDLVLKGDAKCTGCHDEADDAPPTMLELHPSVLAIGKTKHGTKADGRTPTCVDCHGESVKHVEHKGSDKPPKSDRWFSKKTTVPAQERNAACLSCHQKDSKRHFWVGSTHETNNVACTSCHQIHAGNDKVREKRTQAEVCFTCHKDKRAETSRPSHHPLKEGKVTCADCHNSHGSAGQKGLTRSTVNETCYQCHMEKRGPFLHNHQPVNEDCTLCHNPHGTTIGSMLKSRPPFLCQECHNEINTGHPGQMGILPTAPTTSTSSIGTAGRGCLNCHTSIHGDNNPQGATATRRFFR